MGQSPAVPRAARRCRATAPLPPCPLLSASLRSPRAAVPHPFQARPTPPAARYQLDSLMGKVGAGLAPISTSLPALRAGGAA